MSGRNLGKCGGHPYRGRVVLGKHIMDCYFHCHCGKPETQENQSSIRWQVKGNKVWTHATV